MQNSTNWFYLFIGLTGLSQVAWLSFMIELPIFMYFIGLPLLIIPSLTMTILAFSAREPSS